MLEQYFESRAVLEQLRDGPSGIWIDGFAKGLRADGYSWWTARAYLRAAHHLGHFLKSRGVEFSAEQPEIVAKFRRHLKRCRCPKPRGGTTGDTPRGAKCFLRFLCAVGVSAMPAKQLWPPLVLGFREWLSHHRGAAETTLDRYGAAAIELLEEIGDDPGQYDAGLVRTFLIARARQRGVGGTRAMLSAIRLFLRYLATEGKCSPGLDAAVPAIAVNSHPGWRDRK